VAHALADDATRLEGSRLLVRAAAAVYGTRDVRISAKAAMEKVFATETASRSLNLAVQFHGASGLESGTWSSWSTENPCDADFRGRVGDTARHHRP
jgi:alkylation response protein AidB-like acyl-CoA dehydrogenase